MQICTYNKINPNNVVLEETASENGQHGTNDKMTLVGNLLAFQMNIHGPPMALYMHICQVYVQHQ